MALVIVFSLPLAGVQELYCSDIITPWGGDKEIPGKIKWGMSKAETKQILMRTEKQHVEEFPNKLIMKIGTDTITTYTYFFTNNDELAIVEKVRSSQGSILYSSYIDIFKKIHGDPESICFDHDSICWSIKGHGLELKHDPAEDTLIIKTYHRQLLLKYTKQKIERLKKAIKQPESLSEVDKKGATLPDKIAVPPAHSQEPYRSDIITPGGGNKYGSRSIKWGMSKTKVKKILLKKEREPINESPYWLIITKGDRTRKYIFTDDNKLGFVETFERAYTQDRASEIYTIWKKSLTASHGPPSRADYYELEWKKTNHGLLLELDYVKNIIYIKSYDKQLLTNYLNQIQ